MAREGRERTYLGLKRGHPILELPADLDGTPGLSVGKVT